MSVPQVAGGAQPRVEGLRSAGAIELARPAAAEVAPLAPTRPGDSRLHGSPAMLT
jgi:hypothetical protein